MKELDLEQMESLNGGFIPNECAGYVYGAVGSFLGFPWAVGGAIIGAKSCGKYLDYKFGCLGWCSS